MATIMALPYKGNYILTGYGFSSNSPVSLYTTTGKIAFNITARGDGTLPTNYYLFGDNGLFKQLSSGENVVYLYARTPQGLVTNEIRIDSQSNLVQNLSETPNITEIPLMNAGSSNHAETKVLPPSVNVPMPTGANPLPTYDPSAMFTDSVVASGQNGINFSQITSNQSKAQEKKQDTGQTQPYQA